MAVKIPSIEFHIKLVSGEQHEFVRVIGADKRLWEETRARHHWPTQEEAPELWAMFVAWSALHRQGLFPQGFDSFTNEALDNIIPTDETAAEMGRTGKSVDPTQTAATPV